MIEVVKVEKSVAKSSGKVGGKQSINIAPNVNVYVITVNGLYFCINGFAITK
jgi:hypothetical protein